MSLQDKENKWFPKDFDGTKVTSAYSSTADIRLPAKESILQEADRIVNGDRQADYSDPVENFRHIAAIASAILKKELTAEDCTVVLMAVKLARESYKHKRDNLVDLAGYTEILHRIKEAKV